jgi:hypothetical protein
MIKKLLLWILIVCLGSSCMWYLSNKSMDTEKQFFKDLVLENNQHLALLTTRHLVNKFSEIRVQLTGLSNQIVKEDNSTDELKNLFRFQYQNHPYIEAIRFRSFEENKDVIEFHNITSKVNKSFFFKGLESKSLLKRSFYTEVFFVNNEPVISRIQLVKDLRKKIFVGVIEARISISKLLGAKEIQIQSFKGEILLLNKNGKVLLPMNKGWEFEKENYQKLNSSYSGGFERSNSGVVELISFASSKQLEPTALPPLKVLMIEGDKRVESFASRSKFNVLIIFFVGVLCLAYLSKILIYR